MRKCVVMESVILVALRVGLVVERGVGQVGGLSMQHAGGALCVAGLHLQRTVGAFPQSVGGAGMPTHKEGCSVRHWSCDHGMAMSCVAWVSEATLHSSKH